MGNRKLMGPSPKKTKTTKASVPWCVAIPPTKLTPQKKHLLNKGLSEKVPNKNKETNWCLVMFFGVLEVENWIL